MRRCGAVALRRTSLEVYPVAGCRRYSHRAAAVAIVTIGPTPYDSEAEVRLGGDVVAELEALLATLQEL